MPDGSFRPDGPDSFTPDATRQQDLRAAFGEFATGVTIVTTLQGDKLVGMTANSFSSVSLEPPLVMWCPAKSSSRHTAFAAASHFAVHVLAADQEALALAFARRADAFDTVETTQTPQGVPLMPGCLARFECRTHALHPAGDHSIILGEVERVTTRPAAPLLFYQSAFRAFDKGL
ncbi:MAG: flavin reductase family protein [Roseobacter sp.]